MQSILIEFRKRSSKLRVRGGVGRVEKCASGHPWQKRTQEVYIHDEIQIMKIKILPSVLPTSQKHIHDEKSDLEGNPWVGSGVGVGVPFLSSSANLLRPNIQTPAHTRKDGEKFAQGKSLMNFLFYMPIAVPGRKDCDASTAAESVFERHSGGNNAFRKEIRARYTRKAS